MTPEQELVSRFRKAYSRATCRLGAGDFFEFLRLLTEEMQKDE